MASWGRRDAFGQFCEDPLTIEPGMHVAGQFVSQSSAYQAALATFCALPVVDKHRLSGVGFTYITCGSSEIFKSDPG